MDSACFALIGRDLKCFRMDHFYKYRGGISIPRFPKKFNKLLYSQHPTECFNCLPLNVLSFGPVKEAN